MATRTPALAIIYAASALKELDKIWDYNADLYASAEHATKYVDFLKTRINTLATDHARGKEVETNAGLRYITMKRNPSGDGHAAVYRVKNKAVRIVHIFHTKQDWPSKVKARKK